MRITSPVGILLCSSLHFFSACGNGSTFLAKGRDASAGTDAYQSPGGIPPEGTGSPIAIPDPEACSESNRVSLQAIALSETHTCGLTTAGGVRCWGSSFEGQLGDGTNAPRSQPADHDVISGIQAIGVARGRTCALTNDGGLRCWGGSWIGKDTPPLADSITGIRSFSLDLNHVCAVTDTWGIRCWNYNSSDSWSPERRIGEIEAVAMSGQQTCTLDKTGSVQCMWTSEIFSGISYSPRTNLLDGVKAFSVGLGNFCALMKNNDLRCWGENRNGELGDGTTLSRDASNAPHVLSGVKAISTGDNYTCALMLNGGFRCWGDNTYGQLGDGTKTNRLSPPTIDTMTGVRSIVAGRRHACAVLESGAAYCWGENFLGQLGLGTVDEQGTATPPTSDIVLGAQAVATGTSHTCALMTSGGVRCWGANNKGQLGDGTLVEKDTPPPSDVLSGFASIGAGKDFTCGLRPSGDAQCWGSNAFGQLGDNTLQDRNTPVTVAIGVPLSAISVGYSHVCALTSLGSVRCWGPNHYGQTGNGFTSDTVPVSAAKDILVDVQAISAGMSHSCALMKSGGVRCWGDNSIGQLGDGTRDNHYKPFEKDVMIDAKAISVGGVSTCALTQAGGVRCWGNCGGYGPLGIDMRGGLSAPLDLDVIAGVQAITVGTSHTCVLMSSGGVRCWGSNGYGQLGQGLGEGYTMGPQTSDVLTDVVAISAADAHTCAVMSNGGIRCWGASANGRLAYPPPNHSTPTPVKGFCSQPNP